ncbi:baseplate assembly protein [Paracoccus aestuariivivens]|uniref:Baseplate assembly protein n=1 Tax=Paracoccus aestuariivivens TaxID=1820333 RepID=A0A6L6J9C3_9RHOB|nr:baseplate J/gp47 family protein [Paracoccus aestuariivivens]MTH78753.1 baseplate assembly protein [Paracoccus aestuariivivens]
MAGTYTAIDLSQVPAPSVVETIDYEIILAQMIEDLRLRMPAFTALVESDPAYKILEVCAYREVILRQRVNEAARAVMLSYATGTDLENLAALFGVTRLVIDPGDPDALPPVPATYETDTDLRRRTQLSLEGFSTAGPSGAYIYHALSAHGDVLDVSATSPTPGDVLISILSRSGSGVPGTDVLNVVEAALNDESVRPLCDTVTVQAAGIVSYAISATLQMLPGPDPSVVLAEAQVAVATYAAAQHRMGLDIAISGIHAALHRPGVAQVNLTSPTANITISETQASWCTAISVTMA